MAAPAPVASGSDGVTAVAVDMPALVTVSASVKLCPTDTVVGIAASDALNTGAVFTATVAVAGALVTAAPLGS